MTCYETSCCCAPIRWLCSCLGADPDPVLEAVREIDRQRADSVNRVSVAVLGAGAQAVASPTLAPSQHERTRTWVLVNGQMKYILAEPHVPTTEGKRIL